MFVPFAQRQRPSQRIAIVARDLSKPAASRFAEQGAAIHKADLLSATQERLEEILAGADIAIAALLPNCIEAQKKIADAGKAVGIKRFVPNDFGPSCPKGVMILQDRVSISLSPSPPAH